MSDELEWNETVDCQHEACSGKRRYVVCQHGDVGWKVQGYVRPNPNRDVEVKLGDPVLASTLEEAKRQAQWWESEQELWPKRVVEPRD